MGLRQTLGRLLPRTLRVRRDTRHVRRRLRSLPINAGRYENLDRLTPTQLRDAFISTDAQAAWTKAEAVLADLPASPSSWGVNAGDRRAIFHLVVHRRVHRLLDVGTGVGYSLVHEAVALRHTGGSGVVSVDVVDMNDDRAGHWRAAGGRCPPRELLRRCGCESMVRFIVTPVQDYLRSCREMFDLIFLDGDHRVEAVYQEIPLATRVLNPGGLLLLHDYYPDFKPLWRGQEIAQGPVLAVAQLIDNGAPLRVLPLGELPWETKSGSRLTSLAAVVRK